VQMHVKMSNCIVPVAWQVTFASDSTRWLHDMMLLENFVSWLDTYLFRSGGVKGKSSFAWRADAHPVTRQGRISAYKP